MQATLANTSHMIEGFIDGLMARRPALFNLYTTCQPEHGVGDDLGVHQAKLVVESRAYPVFKYNPDAGVKAVDAFDLSGNPDMDNIWPTYKLKYKENGRLKEMEVAMTFADFAITEARFRKHFRKIPRDKWNDNMVPLVNFLEMEESERDGKFPFIWAVDRNQHLSRVLVARPMVESSEERRDFWIMLRDLAGYKPEKKEEENLEQKIRTEVVSKIAQGLMKMAGEENGSGIIELANGHESATEPPVGESAAQSAIKPWIETEECTACDECIKINSKMFAYNEDKKAYLKDPEAGPFSDLVKAAEKCTAGVIHPGLPKDSAEKDIDKWIARAEKFN
jgi:pyruvate-ferredoxin/flavodoxin oxidoreductase